MNKNFIILTLGVSLLAVGCSKPPAQPFTNTTTEEVKQGESKIFTAPISRSSERVTKKPFGVFITPKTSPVQPEKFSGYHTGVDFETFAEEADIDVPILAICDGRLISKRTATGYGGVVVQACKVDGVDVTVVYGHVRLSSVTSIVGSELKQGQQLAVLGKGYSSETGGERKHLHLGIHKGTAINILGYVQSKDNLDKWLDIAVYFK